MADLCGVLPGWVNAVSKFGYCSYTIYLNHKEKGKRMQPVNLFFHCSKRLSRWWWLVMALLLAIMIYDLIRRASPSLLELGFVLFYLVFLVLLFLIVQKDYFRKFAIIDSDALILKKHPFQKAKRIEWSELHKIDLQLFEPVIYYCDSRYRFTMQHEQIKTLRKQLEARARERGIELLEG